jgi:hypothetical protein
VVAHYAIGGGGQQNTSTFNQGVMQLRADYVAGPIRVAYSGLLAKAPNGAVHGKRSTTTALCELRLRPGHDLRRLHPLEQRRRRAEQHGRQRGRQHSLGGERHQRHGHTPYDIYQVSADYRLTSTLRLGGLYGKIKDTDNRAAAPRAGRWAPTGRRSPT